MPTVPRTPGRQVETAPLPQGGSRVQASPATFGGGVARGAQQAGSALAQQAQQDREKALRARLNDADLQLGQAQLELEQEVRQSELEASFGAAEKARSRFEERVGEIRSTIPTDLRDAYDDAAGRRQLGLARSVEEHVGRESTRLEEVTFQAHDTLAQRAIADNHRDPLRIQNEITNRANRLREHLASRGMPAEAIRAAQEEVVSQSHALVVRQHLANGDDLFAEEYFEAHRKQMVGEDRDRLSAALENGSALGKAQRLTDALFEEFAGDGREPGRVSLAAESQALDQARSQLEGRVRDMVVDRLQARYADARRVQAERLRETQITGANAIVDAPNYAAALEIADQAPPELRLELRNLAASEFSEAMASEATTQALAAETKIRQRIDQGGYQDPMEVIFAAGELPKERRQRLLDYYQAGGQAQGLSDSKVRSALEIVTGEKNPDDAVVGRYYEQVLKVLPPGQEATFDAIRKAVAALAVEGAIVQGGSRMGSVSRSGGRAVEAYGEDRWGRDRALTRLDALELGLGGSFQPNRTAQQLQDLGEVARPAAEIPGRPSASDYLLNPEKVLAYEQRRQNAAQAESPEEALARSKREIQGVDAARAARAAEADAVLARLAESAVYRLGETEARGHTALQLLLEGNARRTGEPPQWMRSYLAAAGQLEAFTAALPTEPDRRAEFIIGWGRRFLEQIEAE